MKTSTKLLLWALFWIPLMIFGWLTGTDSVFVSASISGWICLVGVDLALLLENNKKEND